MNTLSASQLEQLTQLAKSASRNAYAPHSHFPVGAAVLCENGQMHAGCNIESLRGGSCAECTAIYTAVAQGNLSATTRIRAILVFTPTQTPTAPCGVCRHMIHKFAWPGTRIISTCNTSQISEWTVAELLPHAFGLDDLSKS